MAGSSLVLPPLVWLSLVGAGAEALPARASGAEAPGKDPAASLPAGFLPFGEGSIDVVRDGERLVASWPRLWPPGDGRAVEVGLAADIRLTLTRRKTAEGELAEASLLVLSTTASVEARSTVKLPGWESAEGVRCQPDRLQRSVLLTTETAAPRGATGLWRRDTGELVDLGGVEPTFERRLEPSVATSTGAAAAPRFEATGRVPRGRSIRILSFLARLPGAGPGAVPPERVELLSLGGWLLSPSDLPREAGLAELNALIGAHRVLELEDGWQGGAERAFGPSAREFTLDIELPRPEVGTKPTRKARVRELLEACAEAGGRPILWVVPFGRGERRVFEAAPEAFVREPGGAAIGDGFLGSHVLDPTSSEGKELITSLFAGLRAVGARGYRIAGGDAALAFYRSHRDRLSRPEVEPPEALALAFAAARAGAGADAAMVGDWDTPPELEGRLDALRPSIDDASALALRHPLLLDGLWAARALHRHRRGAWIESAPWLRSSASEPDLERSTLDEARLVFSTLTGRAPLLEAGVRRPPWWPGLERRARLAAPTRSLDLFERKEAPQAWVLKGERGRGSIDTVGLFSWTSWTSARIAVTPADLGEPDGARSRWIAFDLLDERLIGAFVGAIELELPAGAARLLAVQRDPGRPTVSAVTGPYLATHCLLGDVRWDAVARSLSGSLLTPPEAFAAGPLKLHLVHPATLRPAAFQLGARREALQDGDGTAGSPRSDLVLEVPRADAPSVRFQVDYRVARESDPLARPWGLAASHDAREQAVVLRWAGVLPSNPEAAYVVTRDGHEIGRARDHVLFDRDVTPGERHAYAVALAEPQGSEPAPVPDSDTARLDRTGADAASPEAYGPEAQDELIVPEATEAHLDELVALSVSPDPALAARRRSATGAGLVVGGRRLGRGIGVQAPSRIEFSLKRAYERLEARVGVDDASGLQGSVVFVVALDGVEAYRGEVVRGGLLEPAALSISVEGAETVALIVEDAGDGREGDFADWGDLRLLPLSRSQRP